MSLNGVMTLAPYEYHECQWSLHYSSSFKVTDFRTNQKTVCDFLLVNKGKGKRGSVQRLVVITPLRCSGMTHVLKGSQFYLHTPRSSVNGMNHTCLCLPSKSWYSFTNKTNFHAISHHLADKGTDQITASDRLQIGYNNGK